MEESPLTQVLDAMPPHHFMIADLAGSLAAVCLFPLFVVVPGYAAAWLADLFGFRRRSFAFRMAVSIPLSISVCPIATYLAGRFGSISAVWGLYAISWAYFLWITVRVTAWATVWATVRGRRRISLPAGSLAIALILTGWTALAIFSLVDLQFGGRDYFPVTAFDYAVRTEFIHAIGTGGIPPANPFYFPGHAVPMRYHYFWLLMCDLVDRAGGTMVGPRLAWIGGVVWCGIGLMALTALYFRLFFYRGPATFRRRAITGILLLGITGLDILPTLLLWTAEAGGLRGVLPSVEWWNDQVDGFVYTALWEAHYVSSLIACLMAFLVLWEASRQTAAGARIRHVVVGGIALASAGGASVYVSGVFAIFLSIWTAFAIVKRWWREAANLVCAGLIAMALFLPYVLALAGPASGSSGSGSSGSGGPLLQFRIRAFIPVDAILQGQGMDHGWMLPVMNALLLPVNYFFELGFFLVVAAVWWKKRRAVKPALTREETATAVMVATSVLICTFVRSSVIGNKDLGWRGFLIAQFGLLLWAVDVFTGWGSVSRRARLALTVLLALGAAGTAYDVAILRLYPVMADRGIVHTVGWMAPDREGGKRNYAAREAYEWVTRATAPTAIVQFNPHVDIQETSAFLYANRQFVAGNEQCSSEFGGDPALCPALITKLNEIYPPAGQTASPTIDGVCRSLPIDILVAKDTDPAWSDRRSWVWTQKPVFANGYLRLFRCGRSG